MTLYTQIAANRRRTWIYLLLYVALILILGQGISWYFNSRFWFIAAALLSIGQGIASYWYSDRIALTVSSAKPLSEEQFPEVYTIVQNLTITAGLPMPQLYLLPESVAINAFATGRDAQHASVAMTEGAITRLDKNELAGVLAHELSHVGNEDIRLMSMVMVMAGLISLLSDFFLRSLWWSGGRDDREGGSGMVAIDIALAILAPIAATLIQLAISRRREFLADANAVLLTRYPEGLISALQKIGADEEPVNVARTATAHLYFTNPFGRGGFISNLFSTHPPLEQRIAALQKGSGLGTQ